MIQLRWDIEEWNKLKDLAEIESRITGRCVTASELIRAAVKFVYDDGERMRHVFKRHREKLRRMAGYKKNVDKYAG